ncbi:unnamed protein product [Allacma fusca]|uniref:Uncharacterized protein n=1 Tax=Allacma fusca TaxID=39272 RepID=A0A8J2P3V9_9HEXA|nr:unnamed protein product [Allacma fusca]
METLKLTNDPERRLLSQVSRTKQSCSNICFGGTGLPQILALVSGEEMPRRFVVGLAMDSLWLSLRTNPRDLRLKTLNVYYWQKFLPPQGNPPRPFMI